MRSSKYFASTSGVGLGDVAGLRAVEHDVVDGALLVLEAVERFDRGLRHDDVAADGAGQLLAQRDAALLGDEARLGEAVLRG